MSQVWPADYYVNAITNHYARIVRAAATDGRGYAFPCDDAAPTGGAIGAAPSAIRRSRC